jgi:hypothetical protein
MAENVLISAIHKLHGKQLESLRLAPRLGPMPQENAPQLCARSLDIWDCDVELPVSVFGHHSSSLLTQKMPYKTARARTSLHHMSWRFSKPPPSRTVVMHQICVRSLVALRRIVYKIYKQYPCLAGQTLSASGSDCEC